MALYMRTFHEMVCRRRILAAMPAVLSIALPLLDCRGSAPAVEKEGPASIQLQGSGLRDGRFPASFTCNGANISPALSWSAPPSATKSMALILNDPDAPGGSFVHWVLFDLPPTITSLPAAVPVTRQLPDGSRQGRNDFGDIGYGGPCPPRPRVAPLCLHFIRARHQTESAARIDARRG
jgi:hypothetical protein